MTQRVLFNSTTTTSYHPPWFHIYRQPKHTRSESTFHAQPGSRNNTIVIVWPWISDQISLQVQNDSGTRSKIYVCTTHIRGNRRKVHQFYGSGWWFSRVWVGRIVNSQPIYAGVAANDKSNSSAGVKIWGRHSRWIEGQTALHPQRRNCTLGIVYSWERGCFFDIGIVEEECTINWNDKQFSTR